MFWPIISPIRVYYLRYYELVLASTKVFGMHHKCYAITPIIHDVSGASHSLFIVLFLSKS